MCLRAFLKPECLDGENSFWTDAVNLLRADFRNVCVVGKHDPIAGVERRFQKIV